MIGDRRLETVIPLEKEESTAAQKRKRKSHAAEHGFFFLLTANQSWNREVVKDKNRHAIPGLIVSG